MKNPRTGHELTRHHLLPRKRVKDKTLDQDYSELHSNSILRMWRDRHTAFHILFGIMTLDEIIKCLQRVKRIKTRQ